jgi:hypothetical protein
VAPLQTLSQLFKAHRVAFDLVDVSLSGKSTISVHDEGDVSWDLPAFQDPKQKRIKPGISKPVFGNPWHSGFWIQSMLTAAGKKDKKKLIIKIFPSHYVCERRKNKANETVVSIIDVKNKRG